MRVPCIAEDDAGLRDALTRGLREHGYVVDAVPDGEAATRYLRSYEYELAVLDWRMPDHDGPRRGPLDAAPAAADGHPDADGAGRARRPGGWPGRGR